MPGPQSAPTYALDFADITLRDVARVGGKNASLGELFRELKPKGVDVLFVPLRYTPSSASSTRPVRRWYRGTTALCHSCVSPVGHWRRARGN